jgi:hypothetical protein
MTGTGKYAYIYAFEGWTGLYPSHEANYCFQLMDSLPKKDETGAMR